jgi:alcohol-forming fatty acyl-CoA reductase
MVQLRINERTYLQIPGDMVVNAMMAAAAQRREEQEQQTVYNATSSLRNPAPYAVLYRTAMRYFHENPRRGKNGEPVRTRKVRFFSTIAAFHLFMVLKYKLPLELLHLVNLLCFGLFSELYSDLTKKYKFVMHLVDLYGSFALFKGW